MNRTRMFLAAASALVLSQGAFAVELAQPDEELVQRFVQRPEELAARINDCSKLSVAEAVGSAVCVSTQEARYRRERNALRAVQGPKVGTPAATTTGAAPAATPATLTSSAGTSSGTAAQKPTIVAQAVERR